MDAPELRRRQALPLEDKIKISQEKIKTWYDFYEGNVYVAFSGGKDSTVVLDLVRGLYPEVKAMFVNTGLEYPEIVKFVKSVDNVDIIRPKMPFTKVIKKYGYPVISKEISMAIERFNNTEIQSQKIYLLMGGKKGERSGTVSKKWRYLLNAPFKISGNCCSVMKKGPAKSYGRETGCFPYLGMMAENSRLREQNYMREGCNMVTLKNPHSWPMGFWVEQDVWGYIRSKDLPYSPIYDMGYDRTGCMFCMFGIHMESQPNRFQLMAHTHPKQYKFCMEKLGLEEILKYLRVPYKPYLQANLEAFS